MECKIKQMSKKYLVPIIIGASISIGSYASAQTNPSKLQYADDNLNYSPETRRIVVEEGIEQKFKCEESDPNFLNNDPNQTGESKGNGRNLSPIFFLNGYLLARILRSKNGSGDRN